MTPASRIAVLAALSALPVLAAAPEAASFPFTEEKLSYTINWPSGLNLGEAHLHALKVPAGWQFDLTIDGAVPGFKVSDRYRATATPQLCSLEFQKDTTHGKRRGNETTTFDYQNSIAKRATVDGGKSEAPISGCARDALTFLFFARSEWSKGRVPPGQTVLAGAAYQVRLEFNGAQTVKVAGKPQEADLVTVSVKGPGSDVSFEAYFARDKARTPLMIRCPFPHGLFSLELVR